jgi:hypothetical protein
MSRDYPAKGSKEKKKPQPRVDLARAIEELSRHPFPERSTDDRADLLHAELLLYDSGVGEAVMAVANGERVDDEDLQPNHDLRRDLETLAATGEGIAASDALIYLEYLDRLDHLLGCDGLVRRIRRLYMAALGVVGRRARSRSTAKQMEVPLACAVCLPRRYWRISLHGFDAVPFDRMAGNQGISGNSEHFVGCADAFWCGTRLRLIRSRVARDP